MNIEDQPFTTEQQSLTEQPLPSGGIAGPNQLSSVEQSGIYTLECRAHFFREVLARPDLQSESVLQSLPARKKMNWNPINLYNCLHLGRRALIVEDQVKKFISTHGRAQIVNLGCSLDSLYDRLGIEETTGDQILLVNLDFKSVIELRGYHKLDSKNVLNLKGSLFEDRWLKKLDFQRPTLFILAGVSQYLTKNENQILIGNLQNYFPNAEMIFDSCSELGRIFTNLSILLTGETEAHFRSSLSFRTIEPLPGPSSVPRLKLLQSWSLSDFSDFKIEQKNSTLLGLGKLASIIGLGRLWQVRWGDLHGNHQSETN